MITITLENLGNGAWRATGRIDGRTAMFVDTRLANVSKAVERVAREVAFGHCVNGKYDPEYVRFNPAALAALNGVELEGIKGVHADMIVIDDLGEVPDNIPAPSTVRISKPQ